MAVTITRNFGNLTDATLLTQGDWEDVGLILRQRLIARTEQGLDANGNAFPRYSPAYALAKGRALLGTDASMITPDLTVSGEMLRAIGIEVTWDRLRAKGVTLFLNR